MRPTRRLKRLTTGVAGLACSVALLAGCGGGDEPSAQPTASSTETREPTAPTPETTEPTSTTPATGEDQAAADAEQTVRDYVAFGDELVADETIDLGRLDAFLQDPELTDQRDVFTRFRDQGFYSEGGSTTFEWVKPTKVKLYPKKGEAAVTLTACRNLDDVVVRYKSGKQVDLLSPSVGTYQVFNYDWPNPTSWKIAVIDEPGERCNP